MVKLKYILLFLILSSCSPRLHFLGFGMRKLNMSHNKYSPKNTYSNEKKQ